MSLFRITDDLFVRKMHVSAVEIEEIVPKRGDSGAIWDVNIYLYGNKAISKWFETKKEAKEFAEKFKS